MARAFKSRGSSAFAQAHASALTGVASAAPFLGDAKFKHSFEVALSKLDPDPAQPRRFFDEDALNELTESLKLHGQLQPILVRPSDEDDERWVIVVGERRWRAASKLNWDKMLAIEFSGDRKSAMLVENLMRADLTPAEEAQGLQDLMTEQGWSQREAAANLGLSQARISRAIRILSLPAPFLAEAAAAGVTSNVLVGIAREEDPDRKQSLMARAVAGNLTVAQVNEVRSKDQSDRLAGAPGDTNTTVRLAKGRDLSVVKRAMTALLANKKQGTGLTAEGRKLLQDLRDVVDALLHD
ncbi:ParB/RepB/Spo0J family partition protein [Gluconacetobacter sacchari]|uniref:ParB/RepB/Spo0J family partition protein n=3 Tax=Gluconacetobacter TaxID=89583 RepID=A0A7W4IH65_9PROT|nr:MULTISPECIES: ParB/RepB/Spo0J family partition protein [Gluconacetobacter]MBB2157739.1 ParB/RepB/Spo0J family partition protein [Gluconacetobacter diazotrophicus]MBB2162727.1 ParB/RepB/Spo0J family partition protein [Gluconacetobacter sacchari]GBQ25724.1 chromosome partitioning protein ParB [Gluconacetobacter sacchari DSM 12717]